MIVIYSLSCWLPQKANGEADKEGHKSLWLISPIHEPPTASLHLYCAFRAPIHDRNSSHHPQLIQSFSRSPLQHSQLTQPISNLIYTVPFTHSLILSLSYMAHLMYSSQPFWAASFIHFLTHPLTLCLYFKNYFKNCLYQWRFFKKIWEQFGRNFQEGWYTRIYLFLPVIFFKISLKSLCIGLYLF